MNLLVGYMYAAIVLDHAHLACPIALAWSNARFRVHMLKQPDKFILLPALCVLIPLTVGGASLSIHDPVFHLFLVAYAILNTFHFAAQNYGVCALAGGSARQKYVVFVLTVLPMALFPVWWKGLLWLMLVDLSLGAMHWAQDLRLSSFMSTNWWLFTIGMLAIGIIGFAFKGVRSSDARVCFDMLACTVDRPIAILLGLRIGLGFWHQLMSRWVWSSEGRELLAL